jgi:hypothetical protein
MATGWGLPGDIPVSGDFSDNPDGKSDPMVFRPGTSRLLKKAF